MGLVIQDSLLEIFLLAVALVILTALHFHNAYKYWTKKGVPTIKPKFPLGNTNTFLPQGFSIGPITKTFYDELKREGHKFGGVYLVTVPNLVVVDPDYVRDILSKDFQYFADRGFYHNKKGDPLIANLFVIDSADWRGLRVKLTPTFTSGKMKTMFHSVVECANYMKEAIVKSIGQDVDMKEIVGRYTTDVIGTCAFGIECNSFKHPDAEFRAMGRALFTFNIFRALKAFLAISFPKLALQMGLKVSNEKVGNFFRKVVKDSVKLRQEENIQRNDFLQLLINLQESANFTLDQMTAQVISFFIAGFETSATTMNFGLYELARNPDIQKKLREEICQVLDKHDNKLTYESLNEMKYLGQVLDETLRMYPSLPTLNRRCTKDYTLRDTNIVIEKGTRVLIPALGLQMDPEFYPNPEKFDPDRFTEENKKMRHPFVHLPFGDGPRNCIGLRFGQMQSKIGIATIVKNFQLSVSASAKPLEFNFSSFLLQPKKTIYLKIQKV
ncbi:cytochrome P450 6a2-like [Zophobas morio]|uniref:cytochrome P450 6a2-like n=1 Tax=Zophobas morio TaxID=2755281 RepID=UPI003083721A